MKKILWVCALVLLPLVNHAQSVLDKYESNEKVAKVVVSKKMFELMSKVKVDATDKNTQAYLSLVKKLDNLKVFTTTDSKISADMQSTVASYLKTTPLDELMRSNESGKDVKIYAKSGATTNEIKELLMLITESTGKRETTLMSLKGSFTIEELSMLTDKLKIPGSDAFNKL